MGNIHAGPPWEFVSVLKQGLGLENFIETGTFQGATAERAAQNFSCVVTIELSPKLFTAAEAKLAPLGNVECLLGDSRRHLASLLRNLSPSLFWLDAHWTGLEVTAGADDECPLLGEIKTLAPHLDRHVVLIDDANLFLAPPPRGHKADHWPGIVEIADALRTHHAPYITVFDDIVASVPRQAKALAQEFLIDLATRRDLEARAIAQS
jgi:hypothetical protein